jgi:hypothetical protein
MSRFFRQAGDSDSDSSESEDELMSSEDEAPQKPTTVAKPAMSRFLRTAGSDSSDDSDEDEESDSDSDAAPRQGREDADEEESDEEERPHIRILSAVDKRLKEMEGTGKVMENALKINDWMAISNGVYYVNFGGFAMLKSHRRIRQTCSYDPKATQPFRACPSVLCANSCKPRVIRQHCPPEGKGSQEKDECLERQGADSNEAKDQEGCQGKRNRREKIHRGQW